MPAWSVMPSVEVASDMGGSPFPFGGAVAFLCSSKVIAHYVLLATLGTRKPSVPLEWVLFVTFGKS
ncbi:hypothetical protein GCM10010390_66820 [Streptomyces mordarskii]|uniref:Uncharacterized protein n=1 Tax=Streptomyces mordarskii TaxID=1226758 RepID=A0ABN1DYG3_9ACTN